MSVAVPKEKIIELIEALFQSGYEVEMLKVCHDHPFDGIELQIAQTQKCETIKLLEALSSLGYGLKELKPISISGGYFSGLEIKIKRKP